MTTRAGLWIDHRTAVIVMVSDTGAATRVIESNAERHVRYSGGAQSGASHESQPGTAEHTRERRFAGEIGKYYDEVISCIRDAEAILIFGPGEAKGDSGRVLSTAGMVPASSASRRSIR